MNIEITKLLKWYHQQSYSFPWRDHYSPYKTWISEIMLQQSQVKVVAPYYIRWMKQFPSLRDLLKSNIDDLLFLWQGLGYYNRVKNIFKTAHIIQEEYQGVFPKDYNQLIALKGIGDYTASAILTIGFNIKAIPIDGNIKRVMSRLYELDLLNIKTDKLKKYASTYISDIEPRHSVQALMDLGREICTPKSPKCNLCPLSKQCLSYGNQTTSIYPMRFKSKAIPRYTVVVGLIYKNNKFLISKRLNNKFLGGLWELPGGKIKKNESEITCLKREIKEELDITINIKEKIGSINHQYSHFKVHLILYKCIYKAGIPKPLASNQIEWIMYKQINEFAFPRGTHKLFELL